MMTRTVARLIRVLVVDDSAFMRRIIGRMLCSARDIELVATARDGRQAVELADKHKPDVITLNIEMPEMDGLTALRQIMRRCPTQVLMISSLTTDGSQATLKARELGAADVMAKDRSPTSLSIAGLEADLVARVRTLAAASRKTPRTTAQPTSTKPNLRPRQLDLICIGSSTGGPPVLDTLLRALPSTFAIPIVIAQHMPATFTRSMAKRLDGVCAIPVQLVEDAMPLLRRHVYIAPGGRQTHIIKTATAKWMLQVNDRPADALYRPSVDVLVASAAKATGSRTLAIILTGMGTDGYQGCKALHAVGGRILAQDEPSCVVYGMPKAVTQHALVDANLNPPALGKLLANLAETRTATQAPAPA